MLTLERATTTPDRPHSGSSLLDQIGHTPLLRLSRVVAGLAPAVEVWAKAEWFNPGGSVKDRAAARMLREAEASGALTRDKTIIDSTSGNTGVAYAMLGAALGYRVALVMPANVSAERKAIVRAYGAELIQSDPLEGSDGAIRKVRAIVAGQPERYFYPDQYSNDANWRAHYDTTGPEILAQTDGRVTHFVAGLGTTGTFTGVMRRLKAHDPRIQGVAVGPADELEVIEGLKHLETAIVPTIYDRALPDRHLPVTASDALHMTRRLAREEGLFVGLSSGAVVHAALAVAHEVDHGVIVTLLPDGGAKYLSLGLWA
ncbi:MAG: cysteine synthase [Anaerolineae bacterium]|nr:cysteine synthase [Anaerolineae bacterium]